MDTLGEPNVLLELRFNKATELIKTFTSSYSPLITLDRRNQLYSLYKQATVGDCYTERPPFYNAVARTRWESWRALSGLSKEQAKVRYIEKTLGILQELLTDDPRRRNIKDLTWKALESSSSDLLSSLEKTDSQDSPLVNPVSTVPSANSDQNQPIMESTHSHPLTSASSEHSSNPSSPVVINDDNNEDEGDRLSMSLSLLGHLSQTSVTRVSESTMSHLSSDHSSPPTPSDPDALLRLEMMESNYEVDDSDLALTSLPLSSAIESTLAAETERVLSSLQTQIAALNERIDLLRQDIDRTNRGTVSQVTSWRTVLKSTFRHFVVNLVLLGIVFLFPYWRRMPFAPTLVRR
ncbi:Acyl-CoA binding domain containing 5, partial [Dispira simplex]